MKKLLVVSLLLCRSVMAGNAPVDPNYQKFIDWQVFIGSDVLVNKCLHPNKEQYANFKRNYEVAKNEAFNSIKIFMSHLNEKESKDYLRNKEIELRNIMKKEIDRKGCNSNAAKYQAKHFYENASSR